MAKKVKYKIIESLSEVNIHDDFVFDYELASTDKDIPAYTWASDAVEILMMSITSGGVNYIWPLWEGYGYRKPSKKDFALFKDILEDEDILKIAHNLKFEMHVSKKLIKRDIKWKSSTLFDTMVIGHLLDSDHLKSLDAWCKDFFPEYGEYWKGIKYAFDTPFEEMAVYAATDTEVTDNLFYEFNNDLANEESLDVLYTEYCQPSLYSLFIAEENGAHIYEDIIDYWIAKADKYIVDKTKRLNAFDEVDRFLFETNRTKNKIEIQILTEKMKKHNEGGVHHTRYTERIADIRAGKLKMYPEINFSSPSQIKELLYTKNGFGLHGDSTDEENLKRIDIPFTNELLDLRGIEKINGTYYHGIKRATINGKIHPSFNIAGTSTGRLSCRDPNLQNISKHIKRDDLAEYTHAVRSFFVAPEDYYIVQADFSQAELRMIANISGDENMIEAYLNGIDIHAQTGAVFAGMSLDDFCNSDIYKEYRQIAKSANFGLVYGLQLEGYIKYIYKMTGNVVTERDAAKQINNFFNKYSKLRKWHHISILKARKYGYAETVLGHRTYLPDINNTREFWKRSMAERVAINMPIQGTVGELTVWAGMFICAECDPSTKYFLNVHDSVNFYVRKDLLMQEAELIQDIMENLPVEDYFGRSLGPVPMKVDLEYGEDWLNLKELEL